MYVRFLLPIFLIILGSCQKEEIEIIDEREDTNLTETSDLRTLLHNVSLHDGSFDDMMDQANCFSIVFPYEVIYKHNRLQITSESDLTQIESPKHVQLIFPLRIAHSTHKVTEVFSEAQLDTYKKTCSPIDDDIECIDLQYPVIISTFNPEISRMTAIEIAHDSDLYKLTLEAIEDYSMQIQYPVTLTTLSGEVMTVATNEELVRKIRAFASSCNENDGV